MTDEQVLALWRFLPGGYVLTILVETPILILGLAKVHPLKRKIFSGLWLSACTYPVVILVLPVLLRPFVSVGGYLLVAETVAPVAECFLFALAYHGSKPIRRFDRGRDYAAIVLANLCSFGLGMILYPIS